LLTIEAELVKTANEELGLDEALLGAEVTAGVVETLITLLEGAADDDTAGALDGPEPVRAS
jgi:hypothetical protein